MKFKMGAFLDNGDDTGANMGFGIREISSNSDLFIVRLHKQNGSLRLQTRVGTTNTTVHNFNAPGVTNLEVRAVFDLDTDEIDVFWSEGGNSGSMTGIAINDLQMDQLRLAANTDTTDFGLNDPVDDFIAVDYFTLSSIPEPTTGALLGLSALSLLARRKR